MRYLLAVLLLLSGCATTHKENTPEIKAISKPIPKTISQFRIKPHIHKWDKQTGICWICGASFNPIHKKQHTKVARLNSKQTMVNAIVIESGLPEPEATILWERYKMSGIRGFAPYLIKANPMFLIDRFYTDFVERVKVRTKILKRGYEK